MPAAAPGPAAGAPAAPRAASLHSGSPRSRSKSPLGGRSSGGGTPRFANGLAPRAPGGGGFSEGPGGPWGRPRPPPPLAGLPGGRGRGWGSGHAYWGPPPGGPPGGPPAGPRRAYGPAHEADGYGGGGFPDRYRPDADAYEGYPPRPAGRSGRDDRGW
jgi:hypothetical protein